MTLGFEFVIEGIPKTHASKSRAAWQAKVQRGLLARWPASRPPATGDVAVSIVYFHDGETNIDIDNIIKPILDAMNGIIYQDDAQVAQVLARRVRRRQRSAAINPSVALAEALVDWNDFVYVEIRDEPQIGVVS